MRQVFKTKNREILITVEPLNDKIMGLVVKENGVMIAAFDLASVWDSLVGSLTEIENPRQFSGLERRCYLAHKINELTDEWIKATRQKLDRDNL